MATLDACCYFFSLRTGCCIGGLWLSFYYGLLAYFMYYQMKHSKRADIHATSREIEKETIGFWVLGISFIVMTSAALILLYGTLMKKYVFLFMFLLIQIVPLSVEFFYLFTAILYGIETETFFMYVLPLIPLIYIDMVAYSYFYELRSRKKLRSVSEIHIEY
ncbi:uncharacterized protein LOC108108990 [Drosophila eugracilis]|uniref:uncharacterized protein LOC108108990 n=1 Tax=Drosophila eugracilis TaxID=29029 RepID=UPI0007E69F37|nr:uncharacterized protein LOC108108990 [Drosophila eugracilis]